MTESKKENLFARLARQQTRAPVHEEPAAHLVVAPADTAPSPAPVEAAKSIALPGRSRNRSRASGIIQTIAKPMLMSRKACDGQLIRPSSMSRGWITARW